MSTPTAPSGSPFSHLFDHHPSAVLRLDAQGWIVEANPALRARFGHDAGAMVGQPVSRLLPAWDAGGPPEPAVPLPELLAGVAAAGRPIDIPLRHAQGRRCEVRVHVLPAGASDGDGYFLIARDIGTQRRQQRRLQVQSEILARLKEAVVVLDETGAVLCWNESATRLYGASAQAMAGRPFATLVDLAQRARLQQALDDCGPVVLRLQAGALQLTLSRLAGMAPGQVLCLVQAQAVDGSLEAGQ